MKPAATQTPEEVAPTVLLFLKAPRTGAVKTRLAASIGAQAALRIYRSLAEGQLERLPTGWPTEIHFTPSNGLQNMRRWLGVDRSYKPQAHGDLGERLSVAVEQAFAAGATSVLCIGADCPALDADHLKQAAQALASGADIVFGPANDGGYYLVGLNRPETAIFKNIPWSAENTLGVSLQTADQLGLGVQLLEPLHDVDTIEDLHRAVADGYLPEHFITKNIQQLSDSDRVHLNRREAGCPQPPR